mgnify:FL=1
MKIKHGFVMRDVAGQAVAIATGEASKSFHGMVKLNDTGAVIWNGIEKGLDEAEIAGQLAASYDVEVGQALKDVESFIARMRDAGLVEG